MTHDETPRAPAARPPLRRSGEDRVLGGVCGGLAGHFDLGTPVVRIGAVVLALLSGGAAILVYLVAWMLLPRATGEQVSGPRAVAGDRAARGARTAAGGELRSLAAELRKAPAAPRPDAEAERRKRSRTATVDRAMTAWGDRLRDPDVRDGARRAAAGVSTAVVAGVDGLGRRGRRSDARPTGSES